MGRKILLGASIVLILAIAGGAAVMRFLYTGSGVGGHGPPKPVDTFVGHRADTDRGAIVYTSDFTKVAGDAWTQNTVDRTPSELSFLGPLDNETVGLKVHSLPPHQRVRVSFDLYIIDTWDGSARIGPGMKPCGPDYVEADVAGGPNLLRATFSALPSDPGFSPDGRLQSYPSPIPSKSNPMGTGAAGVCTLGYVFTFHPRGMEPISFPMDGTYSMSYTLQHSADSIRINFAGAGLQGVADESWGLSNVKVEVLGEDDQPPPSESELQAMLDAVVGENAVAANAAYWKLIGLGDVTTRYLDKTGPGFGVDKAGAEAALSSLSKNHADKAALDKLIAAGPTVEPVLRACVEQDSSLEPAMKIALREMVIVPIESPSGRRAAAVSKILGVINTPLALNVQSRLSATPRPPVLEGSAEYAAEWKERFDRAYHLDPGQNLRYIPRPLPPERAKFVEELAKSTAGSRRPFNSGLSPEVMAQTPMTIHTSDKITPDSNVYFQSQANFKSQKIQPGLAQLVNIAGAQGARFSSRQEVIIGPEFENIDLPGDWVVRYTPSQADKLKQLAKIVNEQTGRRISFEERGTEEQVIIVRGAYAFHAYEGAADDIVHVSQAGPAPDKGRGIPREERLSGLLMAMDNLTGIWFIDETEPKNPKMKFIFHPSAYHDENGKRFIPPEEIDLVTKVIADQTGLTFTHEKRTVKRFYAVEEGAKPVQVEK